MHRVAGKVVGSVEHGLPGRSQPGGDAARGRFRNPPGMLSGGEHVGIPLAGEQLDPQQRGDRDVEERVVDPQLLPGEPVGAAVELSQRPGAGSLDRGSLAHAPARVGEHG